jgi:uncharacterized protein YuzE
MMAVHNNIEYDYDRQSDVLYLSIGKPAPSYGEEDTEIEGLVIRHDIKTGKVTGVTILWFSEQDRPTLQRRLPFAFDFGLIK